MYDIKQVKDLIENGGIALSHGLEKRIKNDEMTERDHAFVARAFGTIRKYNKGDINIGERSLRDQALDELKDIVDGFPVGGSKEGRKDYAYMISADKVLHLREIVAILCLEGIVPNE